MASEPTTLDWNRAYTPVDTYMLMNLMEGLVTFDRDLKVQSQLAQDWKRSSDGRVYTFKLRKGVKWSDGVPLRAQDFVFSWKRLLTPSTAASYAYLLFDIEGAEDFYKGIQKDFAKVGVHALDDQTLQVKLARPVSYWIYIPTFWVTFPLRQDIVEKYGSGWEKPGHMVTLGAFTLNEYTVDSRLVMKANPLYHGERGNVDEAVGLIVKDDSTAMTLYETGKFDFLTDIATLDLKRMATSPELKAFPYIKTAYLGFALGRPGVSNVHFRRAISMAIDKSRLGEMLYGRQQGAQSWVPPQVMAHSRKLGLPFDPARARKELALSGINPSQGLELELLTPNRDKNMVLSQFIQSELKKNLGIQMGIQSFDFKTFRSQLALQKYPLFLLSWSGDYPDPDNFLSLFLSDSGNNRTGWKSPRYDQKILKARYIQDSKSRERLYLDAQKLLVEEDAAIMPLYYEPNMALLKPRVQGLELNPINYLLMRKITLKD